MGKFDRVLLATDFDGTLKNDAGIVDLTVLDAIEYFKREGGLFTISTGRSLQGICRYDFSFCNAPVLLSNGALAFDLKEEKIIFLRGIYEGGCSFVREIHSRYPRLSIELYPLDNVCAINPLDDTHRHFSSQGIQFTEINEPSQASLPWQKIMIGGESEVLLELQQYISDSYDDPCFLPTTGTIVEILKKGVDKGSGLLRLADCLKVPHSRAYAVGDGYNDVEMLDAAAAAFVPENGDCFALSHASHIVRSNNDGAVAHAIEILDGIY